MEELNIDILTLHTSGHASYEAIKEVITITRADIVIPIHTEVPEKIKELTDKAVVLKDGEIYEVCN